MILMCVLAFNSGTLSAQENIVEPEPPKVSYEVAPQFRDLIDQSSKQVLATAQVNGWIEVYRDPLVEGTPEPSIRTASRRARAIPLNEASIT